MRKLWVIGIGLMVLGMGPGVWAQEKVIMDTVVVSATKTEEQRRDVPNAVVIMDDADIQESPATSVGDLLGGKTGIDWRTRGDYGGASEEIHIRGNGGGRHPGAGQRGNRELALFWALRMWAKSP